MAPGAGAGGLTLRVVAAIAALTAIIVALRLLLAPPPPAPPPSSEAGRSAAARASPWTATTAGETPPATRTGGTARSAASSSAPALAAAVTRDLVTAAARGDAAALQRLTEAMQAGDPRAYAYSALYCLPGSGCDPSPGDRPVALAASQVRAGLAIRSGDPDAIYHAGLAIAHRSLGRNALRGAAWMLVACRRGHDCATPAELDQAWPCAATDAACRAATTVEDRLQSVLGASGFASAFTLADEYGGLLDSGEVPESAVAYGSR